MADCDLSEELPLLEVPLDASDEPLATALDREIRSLEESIWRRESRCLDDDFANWLPVRELSAKADKETRIDVEQRDGRTEFFTMDTLSSGTQITLTAELPADMRSLAAIRLTIAPRNVETARSDSEWGFVLSHVEATLVVSGDEPRTLQLTRVIGDEPHPFKNPEDSLNPKTNNGFAAYSRIHFPRQAVFALSSPIEVPPESKLVIRLENRVTSLGAFPLVARRGSVAVSDQETIADLLSSEQLQQDRMRLESLRARRRAIPSSPTPITRERPSHLARPTHVFVRGLFLTKDKEVTPSVPEAFKPLPKDVPADRLALARWLVDEENPLTARVMVNRVWARLFGLGIVATEEDFGTSGDPPSHPDLLDHLATSFQLQQNWSLKRLLRSIVLSRTYRQDAAVRPELQDLDPQNQLMARGPRFRMPAEMVRDNALCRIRIIVTGNAWQTGPPPNPRWDLEPISGR